MYGPDGSYIANNDLCIKHNVDRISRQIERGVHRCVHLGSPCSSFSVLKVLFGQGTRSRSRPSDDGTLPVERCGNLLLKNSILRTQACTKHNVFWTLENPRSGLLFHMPAVVRLIAKPMTQSVTTSMTLFLV